MPDEPAAEEFHVEDHPDPLDIEVLETQIRREASAAMGLGDEADLAIFVRDAGRVVAGISGWTWGDCCELQSLWVEPSLRGRGLATRLIAAAEAEAAARGCSQTIHFTYAFQARALYEQNGYELVAWMLPVGGGPAADRRLGAELMYYGGTGIDVALAVIVMTQWYLAAGRALARTRRRSAVAGP